MAKSQNYKTHRQYVPAFHFFTIPILVANVVVEAMRFYRNQTSYQGWEVVVAFTLLLFAFVARGMAVKAQDRVIRLEERLRLGALLPPEHREKVNDLTPQQLVALRFASDDEVPDLAHRTMTGEFKTQSEIKKAIKSWRADTHRV